MANTSKSNKKQAIKKNHQLKTKSNFKPIKGPKTLGGYFKFDTFGTTLKKEIIGGLTTFLALVYILSVNPAILQGAPSIDGSQGNMNYFGIFLSTAITAFFTTFIMGLVANVPIVLTPTMGMNTLFTYSIAQQGIGFEGAMLAIIFANILFTIVTVTPIKETVLKALPRSLTLGFTLSIGFFIAYVGLQQIGLFSLTNGLPIASLSKLKDTYPMVLLGLGTLGLMLLFHFKKVPGGIAISLLVGFALVLIIANVVPRDSQWVGQGGSFAGANFRDGFTWEYDWSGWTWNIKTGWRAFGDSKIWLSPVFYISILLVTLMAFFDGVSAMGTLTHQLDRPNPQQLIKKELTIDATCGILNGCIGTSTIGGTIESSTGIQQGARTGFAAIVASLMFLVAIPLYPIFKMIPTFITGAACVYIGLLISGVITQIEWKKPEFAFAVVMTIIMAMTTYTLINGVAFGIITYTFVMLVTKKVKQMSLLMWPLSLLMIIYFVALAFVQV
ncbi:NCS2 family permease [Entomoplasma freundtii]|nr:NCS2 family permease [Entomoplasma freundtii]